MECSPEKRGDVREEAGLIEEGLRGEGGGAELEAMPQLGEDLAGGSRVVTQTRTLSPCSSGGRRQWELQDLLDRTEKNREVKTERDTELQIEGRRGIVCKHAVDDELPAAALWSDSTMARCMRAAGKTGRWLGLACLIEAERGRERGGGGLHRVCEEAEAAAMPGLELQMEKAKEAGARCTVPLRWGG
jgi:hypothetical protein